MAMDRSRVEDADWWRGAVIYQVYPRSFQDTNGDGIGDLKGITQRLPHIASLGVDAIWLSPFFTSPMADMGYDVSNYCDVDPMFGTLADFDEMMAEAHRLGLKVIIDQVISHTSDKHPWFVESRASRTNGKADWYVWADPKPDGTAPNNWLSIFGGPGWEWDGVRKQYYMHNFLTSQPDLNFHNPHVQQAVLDAVRFWLDRGVDGFRLDTVNFYFPRQEAARQPADDPDAETAGLESRRTSIPIRHAEPPLRQDAAGEHRLPQAAFGRCSTAIPGPHDGGRGGRRRTLAENGGRSTRAAATSCNMCYTFDLLGPDVLRPNTSANACRPSRIR
jgi:alpha-glucosidase